MSPGKRYKNRYTQQRNMSDRRKHDLGLADELGFFLAHLLSDLGRWIADLFRRKSNNQSHIDAPAPSQAIPPALPPLPPQPGTRQRTLPMQTAPRVPIVRPQGPFTRPSAASLESLPFEKTPGLLTKGERAFWWPLRKAVDGRYLLLCKVRLADVVRCPPNRRDERRWFRKIGSYHCDFVICDPQTTAPLLVIELDDRRHRQRMRNDRDSFKDAVLRAAGMPVWRVVASQAYEVGAIRQQIEELIGQNPPRYWLPTADSP